MHGSPKRVRTKTLLDPGACGVRLGIDLRAAAEREASSAGICLSHWIRQVVRNAVKASRVKEGANNVAEIQQKINQQGDVVESALEAAFAEEMEKLNT